MATGITGERLMSAVATSPRPSLGQRTAGLRRFTVRWAALLGLGVVWELAARAGDSLFFPPISQIIAHFYERWLSGPPSRLFLTEAVNTEIVPSLSRMLGGWSLSVVVGILLG